MKKVTLRPSKPTREVIAAPSVGKREYYARAFAPWQQKLAVALGGELISVKGATFASFKTKEAMDKYLSMSREVGTLIRENPEMRVLVFPAAEMKDLGGLKAVLVPKENK